MREGRKRFRNMIPCYAVHARMELSSIAQLPLADQTGVQGARASLSVQFLSFFMQFSGRI